ncbi:hypothetical protein [Microbacterium sp. H83]|uniref:hypothetical protein n=1 Tax=Microbacterium sp. H83 TaxID=1827324 RepID=UPI0007F3F644|nr:hypothetical protein [Microbacterium sp. H83]OAN43464.1 hypothetical protein A4X16_00875 [Microbacterium sp. H83]
MRTANVAALGLVALSIVMTGCTPATDPSATPSASPSSTTEPSSTPAPSPTPTDAAPDPADPSTWIISDGGVGPVEIGGDLAATLAELPPTWENDSENCSWTAWWNAEDGDFGMYAVRGTESETAPISEISVYTTAKAPVPRARPQTAEGLGIGASRTEVLAEYPGAAEGAAQIGDGTWIMVPGDGEAHIFFEFRDGADVASDVVVTTRAEPAYEVCG